MLIEVQRRILVCPSRIFVLEMLQNIEAAFMIYDDLAFRQDILQVLKTTLRTKYLALSIKGIV